MRTPSMRKHCSGQARVTLNGEDYLLRIYGSRDAKQGYHRLLAEWEASGRSASFRCDPQVITIVEMADRFIADRCVASDVLAFSLTVAWIEDRQLADLVSIVGAL